MRNLLPRIGFIDETSLKMYKLGLDLTCGVVKLR